MENPNIQQIERNINGKRTRVKSLQGEIEMISAEIEALEKLKSKKEKELDKSK